MGYIVDIIVQVLVGMLALLVFGWSTIRSFYGERTDKRLTSELVGLFSALLLTLWKLSYFTVLLVTIAAIGVLLETRQRLTRR